MDIVNGPLWPRRQFMHLVFKIVLGLVGLVIMAPVMVTVVHSLWRHIVNPTMQKWYDCWQNIDENLNP